MVYRSVARGDVPGMEARALTYNRGNGEAESNAAIAPPLIRSATESDVACHNDRMIDLPVACTLSPAAFDARRQNLLPGLWRRADQRHELPNGFRLGFEARPGVLADIARAIDAERQCCRFLSFAIAMAPDEGPITLDLTGPAGTREFLEAMFES